MKTFRYALYCGAIILGLIVQSLCATEVKTVSGTTFKGVIVSENDRYISIDIGGSTVKLLKSIIKELDGKPYGALALATAVPKDSSSAAVTEESIDSGAVSQAGAAPLNAPAVENSEKKSAVPPLPAADSAAQTAPASTGWQIQVASSVNLSVDVKNTTEHCEVRAGTEGCRVSALRDTTMIYYEPSLPESNRKGGFVFILFDSSAGKASIVEQKHCTASIETSAQPQTVKLSIEPYKDRIELRLVTKVDHYELRRTDEDGGKSDTTPNVSGDQMFTVAAGHNYIFTLSKPGFIVDTAKLKFDYGDTTLMIKTFLPKNSFLMAAQSLILPGWGQFYGDRPTAGKWYRGLWIGTVALTAADAGVMGISKWQYDKYNNRYPNEPSAAERAKLTKSRSDARQLFTKSYKAFLGLSGCLGIVWTFNIADPLLFSYGKTSPVK
jgi:hypothetical protein